MPVPILSASTCKLGCNRVSCIHFDQIFVSKALPSFYRVKKNSIFFFLTMKLFKRVIQKLKQKNGFTKLQNIYNSFSFIYNGYLLKLNLNDILDFFNVYFLSYRTCIFSTFL